MPSTNSSLALGMITCARPQIDVHDTINELRSAAFAEPLHLFCEPSSPPIRDLPGVVVHQNEIRRGCVGNWAHCLKWLIQQTSADYFLISEDDVAYCQGAREALEHGIAEYSHVGFWSLYTPVRDRGLVGHKAGWVEANRGRDAWGTQAMCLPRSSANILLAYPSLYTEPRTTDYIVAQCFIDEGVPCYYHNPSLTNHLGQISSIGNNWQPEHVGLDFSPAYEPRYGGDS
jgi:GR25 family glycosyltransferase involved in LPS biosynthesis